MREKPYVYCITATCGRKTLLERAVACFIAQTYDGPHTLLIFNNSEVPQKLSFATEEPKRVVLINNHIDNETHKPYTSLGAIYRDALSDVPSEADIIIHWDDDDLYLPNHISEGVKGLLKAKSIDRKYKAYKPQYSWYRHALGVELMSNNLEPSIFVEASFLKRKGYLLTTTDQHYGWYKPLLEEQGLYVDPKGFPSLVYNWRDTIPTFKTSGNAGDPNNFANYRNFSRDHGDHIITPLLLDDLEVYYREVERSKLIKV